MAEIVKNAGKLVKTDKEDESASEGKIVVLSDKKKASLVDEDEELEAVESLVTKDSDSSGGLTDSDFDDLTTESSMDVEEKEGASDGEDSKLPFPRATITNLVRKNISKGKQIKGTVKDEMNVWVAKMVERVTKKMNSLPYTFINYEMLKDAVAPYEDLHGINRQRDELIKKINLIKSNCGEVITQIDSGAKAKAVSLKLEQDELPFPKATITNKIRKYLDVHKTIKGPVKRGLNVWLGGLVTNVSKKMDSFPYPYIDRSMFKEAIEPYEAVGEIELEKERIIQQMDSVRTACDLLVMEIERKFKL